MDYFMYLTHYQRDYIKSLLIQYVKYYNNNKKQNSSTDKALQILNGYLEETAKPKWFPWDNITFIKDCYEYICLIDNNIAEFPPDSRYKLVFKNEVISDEEKAVIRNLLTHPKLQGVKTKNGFLITDMDVDYISKKSYSSILNMLQKYVS